MEAQKQPPLSQLVFRFPSSRRVAAFESAHLREVYYPRVMCNVNWNMRFRAPYLFRREAKRSCSRAVILAFITNLKMLHQLVLIDDKVNRFLWYHLFGIFFKSSLSKNKVTFYVREFCSKNFSENVHLAVSTDRPPVSSLRYRKNTTSCCWVLAIVYT